MKLPMTQTHDIFRFGQKAVQKLKVHHEMLQTPRITTPPIYVFEQDNNLDLDVD